MRQGLLDDAVDVRLVGRVPVAHVRPERARNLAGCPVGDTSGGRLCVDLCQKSSEVSIEHMGTDSVRGKSRAKTAAEADAGESVQENLPVEYPMWRRLVACGGLIGGE